MNGLVVLVAGLLFGAGLAWGGMTRLEVVLDFLRLDDLGLLLVLGGAVGVSTLLFVLAPRLRKTPPFGAADQARVDQLDRRTVIGAAVFGVGWGISGICPGAALASLGTGNLPVLWGIGAMFVGAFVQGRFFPES